MTPAFLRASSAYFPAGTVGAASTRTTSDRARSARAAIFFGFPGATAIASRLVANAAGAPSRRFASTTFCMFPSSAEAKTSAGAPFVICVASVDDEPKLNVKRTRVFVLAKPLPALVKASVKDEPAKTVTFWTSGVTDGPAEAQPVSRAARRNAARKG